jgi:hypothetical protein
MHLNLHLPGSKSVSDFYHQVRDALKHSVHEKDSEAHQVRFWLPYGTSTSQLTLEICTRSFAKRVVTSPREPTPRLATLYAPTLSFAQYLNPTRVHPGRGNGPRDRTSRQHRRDLLLRSC